MVEDARTASPTVLLVEDNPADAELIAVRLEPEIGATNAAPVRLLQADSAAAACATLEGAAVDVVILDLSLPDARWLEALHRVRAAASDVPVIVLTGTADEALALEALRAGAQDYVLKPPPDGATLRRILGYARERQRLLRELDQAVRTSETAALRWRLLAEAGRLLATAELPGPALAEVAGLLVPAAADALVLLYLGDDEVPSVAEVAHVDTGRAAELRRRLDELLAAPVVALDRLRRAAAAADAGDVAGSEAALAPLLASLDVASGIGVPLGVADRVSGLVALAPPAGRYTAAADVEFCRSLADRIGQALERARLFRQARRAVAARDRAFGIVSHDLRNPLGTIQICATALLDPKPPPLSGIRDMAQIIQRSAAWMQQIVQDLLDRASLDAGRLALERRPTTAADVIGAAQVMFAPVAEEEGLEFVVESATDLPPFAADPSRLLQVLSNLLSNAMKFTPSGGRIVLSARKASKRESGLASALRFAVSDTGPGIPPDELAHVFDWFWQSRRRGGSGAGLGLSIARGLIEAHGGRLVVESTPGQGSTFWFTIPAGVEAVTPI
ncbi:MAG TPA: ATP-binding protein [Longimicrobiales bacterium]|nr:ATP-binding protein [Longimicrobiales bacterium]